MTTLLFFDDWNLERRENLSRHVGRPELVPEGTFEDPDHWVSSGYPTVFRHESGTWRCLYLGKPLEAPLEEKTKIIPQRYPLVAESEDGIRWGTPDLTETVPLPDRRFPHQVMPVDGFGQWDCYFDERAEDPNERLKGLVVHNGIGTTVWTSPDGLTWRKVEGAEWRAGAPDPPSTAFWNEVRKSYVISSCPPPNPHPRRIAFSETQDWRTFSDYAVDVPAEVVLMPDALDSPLAEMYGMIVFPYEGTFVGLLWLHHTDPRIVGAKYFGGKTDCQLAYSYNGWHFQRTLREPFMPNAAIGEPGAGTMRPHSMLVDDEQTIRIYSSSSKLEHGHHVWGDDPGAILLHRLRLDGFIYLESDGGPGLLATRPIFLRSGEVRFNVQSGHRTLVQVTDIAGEPIEGYTFDDCEPFRGDDLFWTPRWRGGRRLSELSERFIRLEISMNHARLYAIRGDFVKTTQGEARRLMDNGEEPVTRPGY
jgi:hypothetical protein